MTIIIWICTFCLAILYSTHRRSFQQQVVQASDKDEHATMPVLSASKVTTVPRIGPTTARVPVVPTNGLGTRLDEDAIDAKVCPECYSLRFENKVTCGEKINKYIATGKYSTPTEARLAVARDYSDPCQPCDPSFCAKSQTVFHRPDRIAPPVQQATTHYLTSIDSSNRVPIGTNRTEYFSNAENVHPKRRYLFEYNPSIIVLPEKQRATINGETAYYLSSYRVTNLQQCITGHDEYLMLGQQDKRPRQWDFLALAYLRKDMSILQDVVLNLKRVVSRRMEDFRLFVFPGDQIVVGSFDFMFPIWLQNTLLPQDTKIVEVPQYSPSDMRVYARTEAACTPFIKPGSAYNKNINFFTGNDGRVLAEYKPMISKYRLPASPLDPCVRGNITEPEIKSNLPMRSYDTVDILHFWKQDLFLPYSDERGSACCISVEHPSTGDSLLLGISHSKTPYPRKGRKRPSGDVEANMFFSSLYAMESTYPYSVVARSGRFCLGHATEAEVDTNPFARSNLTPLRIDREYDCPRIHFVSGMSEVVDDPSSAIIGYGINDCVPRLVKVKKSDLVEMLFMNSQHDEASSS